ncbi:hypothetical protein Hypma_006963 [Hypsizygus marmoreus]|uniref:Uncharacterized protein n=1 Tax=Hypsizygus marmoreus TaxID=39966 RepID=A0A369JYS1_HYPMA|nr:hypothetical protein Hypma_006963 [Hypsizygus marmoreus]
MGHPSSAEYQGMENQKKRETMFPQAVSAGGRDWSMAGIERADDHRSRNSLMLDGRQLYVIEEYGTEDDFAENSRVRWKGGLRGLKNLL